MGLSKEQESKIYERLDWLRQDSRFEEHLKLLMRDDVAMGTLLERLPAREVQQIEAGVINIALPICRGSVASVRG